MFKYQQEFLSVMDSAISDAEVRLVKASPNYAEEYHRRNELEALFEELAQNPTAQFTAGHKVLLKEYLELLNSTETICSRAVFFQGLIESIDCLIRFGWLKQ